MASTKKSTTANKKSTSSSKKTTAGKRKTTTSRRQSKPTQRKPATQPESRFWTAQRTGAVLLLAALLLLFALMRLQGILLDGLLQLCGGLVGWGVQLLWAAFALAGIFCIEEWKPVRLRALCILNFPILYSALAHSILIQPDRLSFPLVIQLWQEGGALRSGGVIGGLIADVLIILLSSTGAKLLLVLLMIASLFIIANTTPARLYRSIAQAVAADTEELREQDMTVTPAKQRKKSETNGENGKKKRGNLFAFLRHQRAQRRAARLRAEQEEIAQEELEQESLSDESDSPEAEVVRAAQERYARRIEQRRRLKDVLPEEPGTPTTPAAQPQETDDMPPWMDDSAAPPEPTPTPEEPKKEEVHAQVQEDIQTAMEAPMPEYHYPSIELLTSSPRTSNAGVRAELKESSERLVDTLASFGIDVQIINIVRGPSVTRFEIQMERGIKFSRITALSDDIALALGAYSVRIAPIPDKLAIGIEVPNKNVQMVALRDVIASKRFVQSKASLAVALGKDITGTAQVIDLAKMPHLLIAGTTGSGKSVCINSILISLLYKSAPEDVRLIMIDPKMVELGNYNGIPHLLIPVVTDPKKASGALSWAVGEMERRYSLFAAAGVRNLSDYNALMRQQAGVEAQSETSDGDTPSKKSEPLAQIVIVIDELADLMMVAGKEVEGSICRIAQKARAAGMHLVVATQRPSTDVITGIMKSNIPSRIAFAVASQVESRIILDTPGAEKLIGKGDMLYAPIGMNKPLRIQGCFVSSEEIERVITHAKSTADAEYSEDIMEQIERHAENGGDGSTGGYNGAEDEDELLPQAITIVVESGQASVSMLQRRLKLGYARAARLVDQMEQRGIVGPFEGSKPRQVLITKDDWMQIQLRQKL